MTIPNAITLFRFLLIPVFMGALIYYHKSHQAGSPEPVYWAVALATFILASLSDAADGLIARRFNLRSRLGAIMDPLADKALLVTALVMLSWIETDLATLPVWFVVLVLGRDVLLVSGIICLHLFVRNIHIRPHWVGKTSTALQMVAVSMILVRCPDAWVEPVIWLGGAFTLASVGVYLMQGMHAVAASGIDRPRGA